MHWVTDGNMENIMKSVVSVTVINTQYKEPHSAVLPNHVRRSQCSMEEAVEKKLLHNWCNPRRLRG